MTYFTFLYFPSQSPSVITQYTAHCVPLGTNYTTKTFLAHISLMNPMHHAITMEEYHGFLPIGSLLQANFFSFCGVISGMCSLWTNESTGDQSTGPYQVPRD